MPIRLLLKTSNFPRTDRGKSADPIKVTKPKRANEPLFVQYPYNAQLELAKHARNCLIAVQAELYRLYFQSWDKTQPIELGNSVFRSLGFDNKQKKKALEALEAAKHVKIQWRENQSPLITLTGTGFRLISRLGSTDLSEVRRYNPRG